jgi:hypothetical protein
MNRFLAKSLLAMWAAGGERAEDLDQFRQDKALAVLLGHDLPGSATTAIMLSEMPGEGGRAISMLPFGQGVERYRNY